MRITDLLEASGILLGAAPADKHAAIDMLAGLMEGSGRLTDPARYRQDILAREAQATTAIGEGIAVPHAKSAAVRRPGLTAMTAPGGVDYGAPDGKPSRLFFMIAAPEEGADLHLQILARLMKLLMHKEFRAALISSGTPREFLDRIDKAEREAFPEEYAGEVPPDTPAQPAETENGRTYRILAVTACPTGIAHTYMAAEALEKTAKELGITLKAETNGSSGVNHALTAAEIAACDGIIVAADRDVDMARFNGKPVLKTSVSNGVNQPAELIRRVVDGGLPVYRHDGARPDGDENPVRRAYRQLMNGVSIMLPFVTGGGILIALAFLLDDPGLGYETFGSNTPLSAWLKSMGETAFGFMLPILAGYIAMSIADRPGLMVGFVGGALAVSGATFLSPGGTPVSAGFLGALAAGFAAGYLMLALRRLCSHLPKPLEGIKPVLVYPLAGLFLIALFMCLINPFIGMLNTALYSSLETMGDGRKILLGIMAAGMMAIDMGGPFNKAAYLFGTSTLAAMASGASEIMAAVMIGGMVPPIAIALCCTFFQNRFTPGERKSGLVNYILGLCFITEGAIPFAAADPLRVIPACIVGSGLAGGLSMFFHCALPAPHGGIFVFPVMQNIPGYAAALAAGSLAGMVMLALLKKKKTEVR